MEALVCLRGRLNRYDGRSAKSKVDFCLQAFRISNVKSSALGEPWRSFASINAGFGTVALFGDQRKTGAHNYCSFKVKKRNNTQLLKKEEKVLTRNYPG